MKDQCTLHGVLAHRSGLCKPVLKLVKFGGVYCGVPSSGIHTLRNHMRQTFTHHLRSILISDHLNPADLAHRLIVATSAILTHLGGCLRIAFLSFGVLVTH